jgi:Transglutaminase-like superfamily
VACDAVRRLRSRVRRLAEIRWSERVLLARAVLAVSVTRTALVLGNASAAGRASQLVAWCARQHSVDRLAWAVSVAGSVIPGATCLVQALVLQAVLERSGQESQIHLGVNRGTFLKAHAWVVVGDRTVLGRPEIEEFHALGRLN